MRFTRPSWRAAVAECDRGAAMVEFALVLPILILLVMGIINGGYLFGQKLALNQAVREGARAAVVQTTGTTPVTTLVRNAAGTSLINAPGSIAVSTVGTCSTAGVGNNLRVTASYATGGLVPMPIPGFDSMTLHSEATFRCEW